MAGGPNYAQIDTDTSINAHTWKASLRAAGAALAATDAVMAGEVENAFCSVRPPGHHACRDKAMGFCFFNNVAVAAKYALQRYNLQRVAVVDFDVHHGNGTEDIVAGDERILMVSFFQHPFYPEGGSRSTAGNLVNLPVPAYTRGPQVRELIEQAWIPRLESPEAVGVGGAGASEEPLAAATALTDAGYYDVVVSDGLASVTSKAVRVDVVPAAANYGTVYRPRANAPRIEINSGNIAAIAVDPSDANKIYVAGEFT
eukprot:gene40464-53502_t